MKKYFFFDIDGTLISHIDHDRVVPSTLEAIRQLKQKGHFVSLATGRSHRLTKDIALQVDIDNYVCEGGKGLVVAGDYIGYEAPNQQQMKNLMEYFENLGIPYFLQLYDNGTLFSKAGLVEPTLERIFPNVLPLSQINLEEEIIRSIYVMCQDESIIASAPKVDDVGYILSPFRNMTIFEPDVKHLGIKKMIEHVQGNLEDVVVFGDGANDIKMFEFVPYKIAMGNAVEALKQVASYVTDTSHDDGIYKACKKHGWID